MLLDLRNNAEADIVVLLTNGNYGPYLGVAFVGPAPEAPFAIVQAGAATTGRYTFAHEVAHLFGALHEEADSPEGTIEHAHSFNTGDFLPCIFGHKQRTILHTLGPNGSRIQHYSNPSVYFDGKKTGVVGIRENANKLRNTACTVATFRHTIEPFSVFVTGNDCSCPCQSTSKFAEVVNGTAGATYTFVWETSSDGINWTTSTSYTGEGISQVMPCTEGESLFFRVTVTSSTGQIATSAVSSVVASSSCPNQQFPCNEQLINNSNGNNAISLSQNPSPSYQESIITIRIDKDAVYSVSLYSIDGIKKSNIVKDKFFKKGIETIIIPPIKEGIYLIETTQNQRPYSSIKMLKI